MFAKHNPKIHLVFKIPIQIMASWGSPQTADQNCLIADTCDEQGKTSGEPYLIDGDVFAETYKQVGDAA